MYSHENSCTKIWDCICVYNSKNYVYLMDTRKEIIRFFLFKLLINEESQTHYRPLLLYTYFCCCRLLPHLNTNLVHHSSIISHPSLLWKYWHPVQTENIQMRSKSIFVALHLFTFCLFCTYKLFLLFCLLVYLMQSSELNLTFTQLRNLDIHLPKGKCFT